MAFQKKPRIHVGDSRPQKPVQAMREDKVAALRKENTPEARKQLKKMNDVVYRKGRSNLTDWYAPKGRKSTAKP